MLTPSAPIIYANPYSYNFKSNKGGMRIYKELNTDIALWGIDKITYFENVQRVSKGTGSNGGASR